MEIPARWDDVTPEWMTEALSARFPDARVGSAELLWRSDGNNRRAKFGLAYDAGDGPPVVFVKAEGNYRELHAANGNIFNEVRLFASGADLPLDHPDAYTALVSEQALDWMVVMEDVTRRGADPRDSTRPYTVDQVRKGLLGLARMHARYWEITPASEPKLSWAQTWGDGPRFVDALAGNVAKGMARAADLIPAELASQPAEYFVDQFSRYLGALGRDPVTFLHGDAHIGNTYVLPDDTVGFLDWQVVRRGNWSQDVGYFLQGALRPQGRRAAERELVETYRTALGGGLPKDTGLTAEDAWTWYRASPAWGMAMWMATLGSDGGSQPFEVCRPLVQRHCVAALELDTTAALKSIGAVG